MKPSTELFDLVKSLTKSEKRFFKLSSSLQSGDKNYLKIFEAIEKQRVYDEHSIKEQFKNETFIKHFPSEKNHLYKLILKSLRSFHSDHSVSSKLRQEIKNIEILYKKALYKECNKFVNRAKKQAIQYEKFYYWFELISWEKVLLEEAYESGVFDTDLDALIEEESQVIAKLRNLAEYHVLYSRINYVFRSGGFARNAREKEVVDEIANNHLIKGKNTAISKRAASICYYIKGLCAATNRDYQEGFKHFLKVKQILDDNPLIKEDLAKRYIRTIEHLLYCYIDNQDFDAVFELIGVMRGLTSQKGFKSPAVKVKIFTASFITELIALDRLGRQQDALSKVEDIVAGMESFGDKINKENEIVFSYNIAYAYFGAGEYNKALFWINKVLNDNERLLRQDIYSFARILNLVIHYELGNTDLLEYIVKSTSRFLNKQDRDSKVEDVLLKHLKKLAKIDGKADKQELFKAMKIDLEQTINTPNHRVVLDYFDFVSWLDSKLEGISFSEAVKRKNAIIA